ncbi:MAG: PAS domain S-box protein [Thermoplasmatota archaeon]
MGARATKAGEAEGTVALVRVAVSVATACYFVLFMDDHAGDLWAARSLMVLSVGYALVALLVRPQTPNGILRASYLTTALDAVVSGGIVLLTGGLASPFYLVWFLSLVAVALRFDADTTALAVALYSFTYVGIAYADGQLWTNWPLLGLRITFLCLIAVLSALTARSGLESLQGKLEMQRRAEDSERARSHLEIMLEAAPDATIAIDADSRVRFANPSAVRFFLGPMGDARAIQGRPIADFIASSSLDDVLDARNEALMGRDPGILRAVAQGPSGREVPVEAQLSHLHLPNEALAIFAFRDETLRVESERKINETLSLLTATLESTADGILVVDLHGKIVSYNETFLTLWELPRAALKGANDRTLLAAAVEKLADPTSFLSRVEDRYANPDREGFDIIHFKNGRIFERFSRPQRVGGKPVGRVWSFRDVTERDLAVQQLRESEARYRSLVDRIPVPLWVYDSQSLRFLAVNHAAIMKYGYSLDEFLHAPHGFTMLQTDCHAEPIAAVDGSPAKEDEPRVTTLQHVTKSGETFDVELHTFPLQFRGVDARVTLALDLTDRKRAEEERLAHQSTAREIERLRELDVLKTRFMNTAAHELRTPLTPIRLQLHLLHNSSVMATAGSQAAPDQTKRFEVLQRNFDRLGRLVDDLLDASRLQTNGLKTQMQRIDLERVLGEATESFIEPASTRNIKLDVDIDGPLLLEGDAGRLLQIFFNLLSNALKFTPEGGRIAVHATRCGNDAVVDVQDSGMGISPDAISNLFQPFVQVHDTARGAYGGTGLGLYISKGIAELHGGTIAASSPGGGLGSTFTVRLPLATVGVDPDQSRRSLGSADC